MEGDRQQRQAEGDPSKWAPTGGPPANRFGVHSPIMANATRPTPDFTAPAAESSLNEALGNAHDLDDHVGGVAVAIEVGGTADLPRFAHCR
jgi:hypothetical protein